MAKVNKHLYTKAEWYSLKQKRREQKNTAKQTKADDILHNEKYTILCVRFGNKYSIEYVERLRNMVGRHCKLPYEFVCLTDDPTRIKGVRNIIQPNAGYSKGWWHKVHMFDPDLQISGRILYLDLDVVICANIDKLLTYQSEKFLGIRDFNRAFHAGWKRLNSSVMVWNSGTQRHIFEDFKQNPKQAMRMPGDQDWIWKTSMHKLDFFPDKWLQSYKWEIRKKQELHVFQGKRNFQTIKNDIKPHPECCVAVFHGDPNPCVVQDKFVVDNWQ